jgi:hypothetical protein
LLAKKTWSVPDFCIGASIFSVKRERVERPGEIENVVWQTRTGEPTEYENRLGDALEQVFAAGAEDLAAVIRGLNDLRCLGPHGSPWTEETFKAWMSSRS